MAGFNGGKLILDPFIFTTSTGSNNDVILQGSLIYVVVTTELDAITGIDPGANEGSFVLLGNASTTKNFVLKNNSASSAAINRVITPDGLDYMVPPSNVAIIGYDTIGQMWHVLRVPDMALPSYQDTPADPSTTTNGTGVMMGLAGAIKPMKSGKVMIIVSGNIDNNTIGDGAQTQIRYGTGTAPTNGAALTGTAVGGLAKINNPLLALLVAGSGNFTCNAIVSGLTLGTTYWIDQSLARITGGTARLTNISLSVVEL